MVRPAQIVDIDQILSVCRASLIKSVYARFTFNEMKGKQFVARAINSKRCVVLVAEHDGTITGVLIGMIDQLFDGALDGIYATDLITVGTRSGDGQGLIKAFREWANSRGCDFVLAGVSSGVDTERTDTLYQSIGAERVGGLYLFTGDTQ